MRSSWSRWSGADTSRRFVFPTPSRTSRSATGQLNRRPPAGTAAILVDTEAYGDAFAHLPALLTPAQAAALLNLSRKTLSNVGLQPIPLESRGDGKRQHVRYRLVDVLAFRNGGGR